MNAMLRPRHVLRTRLRTLLSTALSTVLLLLLLLLMLLAAARPVHAAGPAPLELGRETRQLDAWPALTVLVDQGSRLDARGALAAAGQAGRYAAPGTAHGVLPLIQEPHWLRVPLRLAPDAPRDWVAQIDFGILDQVEFYLAEGGHVRKLASSGRRLPEDGALKGRVPAVALKLEPGREYTLLVRVFAKGPRIAPLGILQADSFHQVSLAEQMLQGLLLGIAVCLIAYSLGQWITMREPLYGKYAMYVGGLTLYALVWFGLGEQFLWRGSEWFSKHVMGLSSMLAAAGAYLFVEHILARPGMDRNFSRIMKGGALLCALAGLLWGLGLLDHRILIVFTMTIGSAPMFLGLPGAWRRVRAGDAIGVYFLFSWFFSAGGAVVQALLASGKLPANFWTMHSLQLGVTVDMLLFMRILGLRAKAMQTAMLRAEAEARMKSEFLANMSHEIRTPMNAIIGMSRLALMGEAPPKLRNYLSKILGAGEHLLGIVNDILDHAKMEAGKLAIEALPFSLDEMLDHLASVATVKSDAKGVELIFRVGPGVPQRLVGDPLRLGQVLVNLTGNAVKFTEQGEIVVAVEAVARTDRDVTLEFSVTDTGIGMSEEQMGRLFESFSQADSSTTRKYGGTGLGLSISRQLVELMGGRIAASSAPGAGSRFVFSVPLGIDAQGADGQPAAPVRRTTLAEVRALVVDDSATARAALAEMLASLDVQADTAASGEECLAALARADASGRPYGIVLMDYLMPGLDGVETIRRIRRTTRSEAPPAILMVSVCSRDSVLEQEGELPVDAFLHKPVGPALLYHSLLQVLDPQPGLPDAAALAIPSIAELPRLDGARILLAEDNANNREVALDFMAAARMQVDVAFDGRAAVRMAREGDYDLVLMDIQMPELDGLGAAREIRADPRLRTLPIVAMTAHALPSDRRKSLDAGMNDHVTKPIDPDLLFCSLLKWIDPARLVGREPPPPGQRPAADPADKADAGGTALAALPAVPGLDWRQALDKVDGQRSRLEKRASSFVREYADAPRILREALGGDDHPRLQSLAHNLKSSAAYVGAFELSAAAHRLEQDLRNGQADRLAAQVPGLVTAAETVLAALAQLAQAAQPTQPAPADAPHLPGLARIAGRLRAYLQADDARAEDALAELEAVLAGGAHRAALAELQRAVQDLEYEAALAPLAALVAALELNMEEPA
ncbi:response regulator [Massilia sp. X63]|uniref:hybrid sensor histidine kinase/response regulator n=1 Tax=Massilia sp. X63 TaxID=3237285 RepID=UPI0034DDB44E